MAQCSKPLVVYFVRSRAEGAQRIQTYILVVGFDVFITVNTPIEGERGLERPLAYINKNTSNLYSDS